ncbi:MAG: multicopper oxidase domain-containing protein [Thermomicrobiales bacterium]
MSSPSLHRRQLLQIGAGGGAVVGGIAALQHFLPAAAQTPVSTPESMPMDHSMMSDSEMEGHSSSLTVGEIDTSAMAISPEEFIQTFDYGTATVQADGTVLREWNILAIDREIEIAPGVFFPAWTYNGQVPGPTLRCNEGDLLRIHFTNGGSHPHTLHFHGIHSAYHDGVTGIGRGDILVGEEFTYEFTAKPYGLHLYHCHSTPLKRHIHKGLYGTFIINPDPVRHGDAARHRHPDYVESAIWQEYVMMMNAFDTTFDSENEVYAINSVAFHFMKHPIVIDKTRPVRIYLVNVTEFDPINSFHLHANFFNYFDTGTTLEPTLRNVDIIAQVQGQRGILEIDFSDHENGLYMFHAHVSEFAELGWMSAFDVR